jgi:hypothetical protein
MYVYIHTHTHTHTHTHPNTKQLGLLAEGSARRNAPIYREQHSDIQNTGMTPTTDEIRNHNLRVQAVEEGAHLQPVSHHWCI